jgi:hypothetical protein
VVRDEVFINYRGMDSHSYGALLHAELSRRFRPESVFLDTESIPAGADYVEELLYRVRRARVVLAVIGPRWLDAAGGGGRRELPAAIRADPEALRRVLRRAVDATGTSTPVADAGAMGSVAQGGPVAGIPAERLGRCRPLVVMAAGWSWW